MSALSQRRSWWRRLLCFIGFHDWLFGPFELFEIVIKGQCTRCGATSRWHNGERVG